MTSLFTERKAAVIPPEGGCLSPKGRRPDYRIDPETGCWEWLKFRNRTGYAVSNFKSAGISTSYGHRAYYLVANGLTYLPPEIHIHHLCENTQCVNPAHLVERLDSDHLRHHMRRDKATLTQDQVNAVREAAQERGVTLNQIAERFGVTEACVDNIVRGRSWMKNGPESKPDLVCLYPPCGQVFSGRRDKKFCCKEHQQADNVRRQSEQRAAAREARRNQTTDCLWCGEPMPVALSGHEKKWCSVACSNQGRRRKVGTGQGVKVRAWIKPRKKGGWRYFVRIGAQPYVMGAAFNAEAAHDAVCDLVYSNEAYKANGDPSWELEWRTETKEQAA